VKVQEEFLKTHLFLKEATWLYWSLVAIAAGQVLYAVFCPRIVKKYGADQERYTIEALSSFPRDEFVTLRETWITQLYREGGLKFQFANTNEGRAALDQALLQKNMHTEHERNRHVRAYVELVKLTAGTGDYAEFENRLEYLVPMVRNWPEFLTGTSDMSPGSPAERLKALIIRSYNASRMEGGEHEWKVSLLSWWYKVQNHKWRPMILLIGALYASGSIYFLWRVFDGLVFMIGSFLI
jgi:hypothetical protein